MSVLKTKRALLTIIVGIFCLFYLSLNASALQETSTEIVNTNAVAQEKLINISETNQRLMNTSQYLEYISDIAKQIFKAYANLLEEHLVAQNTKNAEAILINKSVDYKVLVTESADNVKAQEKTNQNETLVKEDNKLNNNVTHVQKTSQINNNTNNILIKLEALFKSDSTKVSKNSLDKVKMFAKFLKDNPNFDVKLIGHSSHTKNGKILTEKQTEKYNIDLSLKRANTIKNILVKNGIDASRLITEGKGFSQPIASNKTIEGQKKNRRIEAVLINKSTDNKVLAKQ